MSDPHLTVLSEWERLGEAMFPRSGAFRRSEHRDARSRLFICRAAIAGDS
jgi:hypothetical protein